ncbi:MAG: hypothetical protein R2854_32410 [Caldilineaceae bacterium]
MSTTTPTADFTAFDGRENELRARSIRIFPDKSTSQDDGAGSTLRSRRTFSSTVRHATREADGFAVVDIASAVVKDILPMGLKDHSRGVIDLQRIHLCRPAAAGCHPGRPDHRPGRVFGPLVHRHEPRHGRLPLRHRARPRPQRRADRHRWRRPARTPFACLTTRRVVSFELNSATGEITLTGQQMLAGPTARRRSPACPTSPAWTRSLSICSATRCPTTSQSGPGRDHCRA